MFGFLPLLAGGDQPLLGTATLFAGFGQFRKRRCSHPVGGALQVFRLGEPIGSLAAGVFRLLQFVEEVAAFLVEFLGRYVQLGDFLARLFLALAQRGDMVGGACRTRLPGGTLLPYRLNSALTAFRLAAHAFVAGTSFRQKAAVGRDFQLAFAQA
ncbi:hypothetical protein D3C86_1120810 [compost metagenome]